MLGNLNGPTLIVILFIVLLLFGAPKLPGLAKSLGQSMKILKKEVRNDDAGAEGTAKNEAAGQPEAPGAADNAPTDGPQNSPQDGTGGKPKGNPQV